MVMQRDREMVSLRDMMSRLLEESLVPSWAWGPRTEERAWRLPLDVYATDDEIVIQAAVPGLKPEDVEITLEGDTLTIKGEFKAPLENVNYLLQERGYGVFVRTLTLNIPVEADKATARFENGLLTLVLPKVQAVRPRVIKVKSQ